MDLKEVDYSDNIYETPIPKENNIISLRSNSFCMTTGPQAERKRMLDKSVYYEDMAAPKFLELHHENLTTDRKCKECCYIKIYKHICVWSCLIIGMLTLTCATLVIVFSMISTFEDNQQRVMTKLEEKQQLLVDTVHDITLLNNNSKSQRPNTCSDMTGLARQVVTLASGFEVMCDTVTAGGGWVVMQRRISGDVEFNKTWVDYKYGFGHFSGSFWMGLEKIHQMVFKGRHELQIDFKFDGKNYYARYNYFNIFGETENYTLRISGYSGNATDEMKSKHNDMPFSTHDRDNDKHKTNNCAEKYKGGWWHEACHDANLNGEWGNHDYAKGLTWKGITSYTDSATFTEMKFRPLQK